MQEEEDCCIFVRPLKDNSEQELQNLVVSYMNDATAFSRVRQIRDFGFVEVKDKVAKEQLMQKYDKNPELFKLNETLLTFDRATKPRKGNPKENSSEKPKGRKRKRSEKICFKFIKTGECEFGEECKFSHEVSEIAQKQQQIPDESVSNPAVGFAIRNADGQVVPARGISKYYKKFSCALPLKSSMDAISGKSATQKPSDQAGETPVQQKGALESAPLQDSGDATLAPGPPSIAPQPGKAVEERIYVHVMPNGLCVVGISRSHPACTKIVKTADFAAGKTDFARANISGKKKKKSAQLRAGDVLCVLECTDGSRYTVPSAVGGRLVEVSSIAQESPGAVGKDSENTGFLAILYPSPTELYRVQSCLDVDD